MIHVSECVYIIYTVYPLNRLMTLELLWSTSHGVNFVVFFSPLPGEHLKSVSTPCLVALLRSGFGHDDSLVGNMTFIFPFCWEYSSQLTFTFFRGVGIPPTRT